MTDRPPIPNPPYTGSCLCGAVQCKLDARPLAVNACHCTDCKKTTGATNVVMLIANNEAFSFNGEIDIYRKRADSGRELDIKRCATCGTRMFHHNLASNALVFIAAGTLYLLALGVIHLLSPKMTPANLEPPVTARGGVA